MTQGRFIVLEGIDGAGTTTQTRRLQAWLEQHGQRVHTTREPSDGPIGTLLRQVLSGRIRQSAAAGGGGVCQEAIALLFAADRLDHISSEVNPALLQGFWVLSDRYVTSSIAYQGTMVGVPWTQDINRFAPEADLTFLLDLPASVAMERLHRGRVGEELYEKQEVLERVAAAYREEAGRHPESCVVVDATCTVDEVFALLKAELHRRFPEFPI